MDGLYQRWASYDIVGTIQYHVAKSPIQWEGKHVKGHQDDTTNKLNLDEWALGKIVVDAKAGEELLKFRTPETKTMLEGESWRLALNGIPIAGNIERRIKLTLGEPLIREVAAIVRNHGRAKESDRLGDICKNA